MQKRWRWKSYIIPVIFWKVLDISFLGILLCISFTLISVKKMSTFFKEMVRIIIYYIHIFSKCTYDIFACTLLLLSFTGPAISILNEYNTFLLIKIIKNSISMRKITILILFLSHAEKMEVKIIHNSSNISI